MTTGFGYVSQQAWLQRGTIRENIVWGQVFDETFYRKVIHACCLREDLEQLGGDGVFVGDKGMTLSGGQRMRVALARAVYQKKQIYLLDDILSSLDANVANHVIKYCIFGLLGDKTRLVVTEQRSVLKRANQILEFNEGQVTVHDPAKGYTSDWSEEEEIEDAVDGGQGRESRVENPYGVLKRERSRIKERQESLKRRERVEEQQDQQGDQFGEGMETGSLRRSTLLAYWKAVSARLGIAVLLSVCLMQISRNYSDVLLAQWVAAATSNNSTPNEGVRLIGIYSSVVLLNSVLTLVRSFLFAYAGIKAAVVIHQRLLKGVVYVSRL